MNGQITPDDIRNPPCGDDCPWKACLICKFKGGEYGHADEQPVKNTRRKEDRNGSRTEHLRPA